MVDPLIAIVDDDDAIRDALAVLLEAAGFKTCGFGSAEAFLDGLDATGLGCTLLDVRLPAMDGMSLLKQLCRIAPHLPIIMITGHGDVPMAVDALKAGAMDFIEKPVDPQRLLDSVRQALTRDAAARQDRIAQGEIRSRLERLTPREREVMDLVVLGHANKVIAARLGISPRTVEIHRARVMEKMAVETLADLVRLTLTPAVLDG
ncbi:MAG: response regulator [Azospirillum sp.]|nr:response regulator [Azospirillum sp.]